MRKSLALFAAFLCLLLFPGAARADAVQPKRAYATSLVPLNDWQPPRGEFKFDVFPALDASKKPIVYLCPRKLNQDYIVDANGDALLTRFDRAVITNPADKEAEKAHSCMKLWVQRLPDIGEVSHFSALLPDAMDSEFERQGTYYYIPDIPLVERWLRKIIEDGQMIVFVENRPSAWFDVGVTSRKFAGLATAFLLFMFAWGLVSFARHLGLPGVYRSRVQGLLCLPLRLIAKSDNRASLSQFQIMLWTFVVAGGAIYVVLLNGALIPVSESTLVLLGISGGAAVLAKLKDERGVRSPSVPLPGPVLALTLNAEAGSSDLLASWTPPADDAPITHYEVEYSSLDGKSRSVIRLVTEPAVRIVGLRGITRYRVCVRACNASGHGEPRKFPDGDALPADVEGVRDATTGPSDMIDPADEDQEASTAPDPATKALPRPYGRLGLRAVLDRATESQIELEWLPAGGEPDYIVQYRPAVSAKGWALAPDDPGRPNKKNASVRGLESGTEYQFRIRRLDEPSRWSAPVTARTLHVPRWSDLVSDDELSSEIDVARVQMLIFTVITSLFVVVRIAKSGIIPDIPQEYVYLMGISNSVYLTSKWVRR